MTEINNKAMSVKHIIKVLYSFIAAIGVVLAFIQYFSNDIVELEVRAINKLQLTKVANIDGLTVEFLYKDSVVKNLWQITYLIQNVGSKTIVAKGDSKNILKENLFISFNDSVKVLFVDSARGNFPIAAITDFENNVVNLDFEQWQKSEYTYIVAIVENFGEAEPSITIDRRNIVDAKVTFLEQKPVETKKKKLIEYLVHGILFDILKWEAVFLIVLPYVVFTMMDIRAFRKKTNISKRDKVGIVYSIVLAIMAASIPLLWFF